ncbi:MAG: MJ0307 family thioredoxin [Methanobrevibacter sp.]|nr:MJ0307 family thioredoxin [Methanobrevibacter sp.]
MVYNIEVFTSPTCGYCPMAIDVVNQAKEKLQDKINVEIVNVATEVQRAQDYGIMGVPAIAIDGNIEFVGAPTLDDLLSKLK